LVRLLSDAKSSRNSVFRNLLQQCWGTLIKRLSIFYTKPS
jgi:hypothetical protein